MDDLFTTCVTFAKVRGASSSNFISNNLNSNSIVLHSYLLGDENPSEMKRCEKIYLSSASKIKPEWIDILGGGGKQKKIEWNKIIQRGSVKNDWMYKSFV